MSCGSNDRTNNPTPDAATIPDAPAPSIDAAPIDAAMARTCGGFTNAQCADTEYCDYRDNTCGIADGAGTCAPRPTACPAVVGREVCGCDGKVHASECAAYVDGFDLSANESCDKVAGKFACGYQLCDLRTEYCRREPHPDTAETFACVALPVCEGTASCACLTGERCGDACTGDAKLGLTLSCPSTSR